MDYVNLFLNVKLSWYSYNKISFALKYNNLKHLFCQNLKNICISVHGGYLSVVFVICVVFMEDSCL